MKRENQLADILKRWQKQVGGSGLSGGGAASGLPLPATVYDADYFAPLTPVDKGGKRPSSTPVETEVVVKAEDGAGSSSSSFEEVTVKVEV